MATSISIKSKNQAQESTTTTVNYANPKATNAQLLELAQKLNALTYNSLNDVTRIDKESLTDTPRTNRNLTAKLQNGADFVRNLSVTYESLKPAQADAAPKSIYINGDGISGDTEITNTIKVSHTLTGDGYLLLDWITQTYLELYCYGLSFSEGERATGTITVEFPQNDRYYAESITITVT